MSEFTDGPILVIDKAYFKLPKGFKGTKEDAMQLFLEHWCNPETLPAIHTHGVSVWEDFKNLKDGRKPVSRMGVADSTEHGWIYRT